ncbi:MAG TPA: TolC family protein [Longimicrobiales bacterium]|nr:TolC family protein [Longimicrobiales bacterium]
MNNYMLMAGMALSALAGTPRSGLGQAEPLTLERARAEARTGSLDALAARARARAAEAGRGAQGSFLWPQLALEAGAVRSDDPVAAFGGRLRQGAFTEADFDPARLNDPGALTDWSGAVGVSWAPLDASAAAAYSASALEADAAARGAEWATRAAIFRAEALYMAAEGAEGRLTAARSAGEAGEATLALVERRAAEGLLTDADALQARAAAEGARARVIDAERAVADARARLRVALGWPQDRVPVPVDTVFGTAATEGSGLDGRADLEASSLGVRAAEARLRQATRARLPTVRGFARLETHSASAFSDARGDWTAGFVVGVPVFAGFSIRSRERAAGALLEASRREHELRVMEAGAQVQEARRGLEAARRGAEAAQSAAEAADEAARLMRLRFEQGLITTADLLGAESVAAALRTQAVDARLQSSLAAARLAFLTDTTTEDLDR